MKRFFVVTSCMIAGVLTLVQVQQAQVKTGIPAKAQPAQTQKDLATLVQASETKPALQQIQAGADVNQRQGDGSTPLLWAVNRTEYDIAEALLAKKADPNVGNEFGAMPLTEAARQSDVRLVKMLLDAGAKVDTANPDGETALMLAVKGGNAELVKMLVDKGANVNTVEAFHSQTPLMYAASGGKPEIVKLLLAKGADVKPHALYSDWPSQITSEPRWQFRPTGGLTALLYATRGGCYECVELLIQAGANVNDPTPEAITPLMIALDNNQNEIAKLLMDKGAKIHVWDWWGRTPLWIAVDRKPAPAAAGGLGAGPGGGRGGAGGGRGGQGAPAGAGAGRGGPGGGGRGPGAAAAANGPAPVSNMDIINALLAAGADPNVEMNFHRPNAPGRGRFGDNQVSTGTTPLFRTVQNNDLEAARVLLAKGADPNLNTMGYTAFLYAAGVTSPDRGGRGGGAAPMNKEMLDLMMEHKANPNTKVTDSLLYSQHVIYQNPPNNEGTSPLHEASRRGQADLVKYLLEHGADPNITDIDGKKPIDVLGVSRAAAVPAPAAAAAQGKGPAGGRGGPAGPNPAALAEIRTLLQDASAKK